MTSFNIGDLPFDSQAQGVKLGQGLGRLFNVGRFTVPRCNRSP